jgi:leader peptidase (prepilin peptidase)/N-methyltransferase
MSALGWLTQPAVFPWVAFALGLCAGSFLNVVIHRLPLMMEREWLAQIPEILEEARVLTQRHRVRRLAEAVRRATRPALDGRFDLWAPRSRCPACARRLRAWENVPLASWIALGGRCAGCGAPIPLRYPAVELLAGLGAAGAAWHFGFGLAAAGAALFIWAAIALAFIDQATGYLPDDLTLPLLWTGLLFNVAGTYAPLADAVIGAVAGYLSLWLVYHGFRLLTGKEGMGYGDFKMNAAVGAFVGWKLLPLAVLVSACAGLVAGIAQMLATRGRWEPYFRFRFGPYLALGGLVALFGGEAALAGWLASA